MITTGSPSVDGLVAWLTNGGSLSSPGAAIGLAFIIHSFVVPTLEQLATHFNWGLSGPNKTYAVYLASIVLVMIVGLVSQSTSSFADSVALGVMVAQVSMGIHATKTTAANATKAVQEQEATATSSPGVA